MRTRSLLHGLALLLGVVAMPASAFAADGFARSSGSLRAGAGSDYPTVARVSRGDELEVFGCLRRYTWCDVAVDDERGWFPGNRIGFLRDGRRVTLSDDAGLLGLTIVTFGMADYWGDHYSDRSWYQERRWWRRHDLAPPSGPPRGAAGLPPNADRPVRDARPPPDRRPVPTGDARPSVGRVDHPSVRAEPPAVRVRAPRADAPHAVSPPNPRRPDVGHGADVKNQGRAPTDRPGAAGGPVFVPPGGPAR